MKIAVLCPKETLDRHVLDLTSRRASDQDLHLTHQPPPPQCHLGGMSPDWLWHLLDISLPFAAGVGAGILSNWVYDLAKKLNKESGSWKIEVEIGKRGRLVLEASTVNSITVEELEETIRATICVSTYGAPKN